MNRWQRGVVFFDESDVARKSGLRRPAYALEDLVNVDHFAFDRLVIGESTRRPSAGTRRAATSSDLGAGVAVLARPDAPCRPTGRRDDRRRPDRAAGCCCRPGPGRTYPDHAMAVTRVRFDAWLRDAAIAKGAEPVTGRVAAAHDGTVELDDGRRLVADVVVGADGATSRIAATAGLVDPRGGAVGLRPAGLRRPRRRAPDHRLVGRRRRGGGSPATAGCFPARRASPTSASGWACAPTDPRPRGRSSASMPSVPTSADSAC